MAAIELRGVTKRYPGSGIRGRQPVTALREVDLTVERGEIVGFLGPNGAGKSTAIDLLLGFSRPTSGSVRVLGTEVTAESVALRERIGVLPEGYGPIGERTGRQHVEFAIETKGADDDPDAVLERVGMLEPAEYSVDEYSRGMVQRIMLAMAITGAPELLILDEPTTGLDPNGARLLREIVTEEHDRGATIFFSSHIMEQVEAVCDRVGILQDGTLVAMDTLEGLNERLGGASEVSARVSRIPAGVPEQIRGFAGVHSVTTDGASVVISCDRGTKARVISALYESGASVEDVSIDERTLEDLFSAYTQGGRG